MFLENAKHLIENGVYDPAAFNIDQYCQLILKYKLLTKTGTYPRTHSPTRLVSEFSKLVTAVYFLFEKGEHLLILTKIGDAYVGSSYLPRRYNNM